MVASIVWKLALAVLVGLVRSVNGGALVSGPAGSGSSAVVQIPTYKSEPAGLTALQQPLLAFMLFAVGSFPTVVGVVINDIRVGRMHAESGDE